MGELTAIMQEARSSHGVYFDGRLTLRGPVDAIMKRGLRNRIVRAALMEAGSAWITNFLGQRFTDYVKRAPFNYRTSKNSRRALELPQVQAAMRAQLGGWNPFTQTFWPQATQPIFMAWRVRNPQFMARGPNGKQTKESMHKQRQAFTAWAKGLLETIINKFGGSLLPFVFTGDFRHVALSNARPQAIARGGRAELLIRVPQPHPIQERFVAIFRTIPVWEGEYVFLQAQANIQSILSGVTTEIGQRRAPHQTVSPQIQQRITESLSIGNRSRLQDRSIPVIRQRRIA